MSRLARSHPDDPEMWANPIRLVPTARRRCWCGRSVSWNGVECAEHDDPPTDDIAEAMRRHPSGKDRS